MKKMQKEFKISMQELGYEVIQFKTLEEGIFRLTLGQRNLKAYRFFTVAYISGDTLKICSPAYEYIPRQLDLAYSMAYWSKLAFLSNLTAIELTTRKEARDVDKINMEYLKLCEYPTWAAWHLRHFIPLAETMGFTPLAEITGFSQKSEDRWVVNLSSFNSFWDVYLHVFQEMKEIKKEHPALVYSYKESSKPNDFLVIHYDWEGESGDFRLHYDETEYQFIYKDEAHYVKKEDFLSVLQNTLLKIRENRKLINLLEPPTANLVQLFTSIGIVPYGSITSKSEKNEVLAKHALDLFIHKGISYQAVEEEAVRLYNNRNFTSDLCTFQEKPKEYFIRFFNKYFLVFDIEINQEEPLTTVHVFESTNEVVDFYQQKRRKQLMVMMEEKGFSMS